MAEDGKIVFKVTIDDSGATAEAEAAGKAVGSSFDTSAKGAGGLFEEVMTGAARRVGEAFINMAADAAKAVGDFMKDSLGVGMDFDSAMSQVAATLGYSVEELNNGNSDAAKTFSTLRDFALEMGETTAFSATEAAEALNYMALAGYDAETSMKMLPNVLNLAASGGMDLATASDVVTDIQSALGLSIEETTALVDQMAKTASTTNTSVSQLGEAMLQIGATATFMSGGSAEVAQVLGILADNGIKGAEGGTHLRNMLLSLAAPTEKAGALLEDLGVSIFDSEGNMRSFFDIFGDFNTAMEGWTEADKIAAFDLLFNARDTAAALALMNTTGERWEQVGDAIDGAEGSAQKMADVQLDNLAGDLTLLNSAFEGFQIAISDKLAPIIREVMPTVIDLVGQLTDKVKNADFSGLSDTIVNLAEKVYEFALYLIDHGDTVIGVIEGIAGGFAAWKGISIISKITGEVSSLFGWISKLGGFLGITGGAAAGGLAMVGLSVATVVDRAKELNTIGFIGAGHSMEDYTANVEGLAEALEAAKADFDNLAMYGGDLTMAQDTIDLLTIALANAQAELDSFRENGEVATPAESMAETGTTAEETSAQVADASTAMMESIAGVSDTVTNEFVPGMDEMSNKAAEATENVNNTMSTNMGILSANAAIWGEDVMISFANGLIAGNNNWLIPTLEEIGGTVAGYLEHSEPDKGPLSNDSTWMPDMMLSFISGIKDYTPDLKDAIVTAFDFEPIVNGSFRGDIERNVSFNMKASGRMGTQVVVPVNLDGRQIARATAWSMGEQMAWEEMG